MAWVTPKTDWATDDGVGTDDLNRIEGNIDYLRTVDEGLDGRIDTIEAQNLRSGTVTLLNSPAGKGIIYDSGITADTIVICTVQTLSGVTTATYSVDSRSVGVSITIKSNETADRSVVGYILIEP